MKKKNDENENEEHKKRKETKEKVLFSYHIMTTLQQSFLGENRSKKTRNSNVNVEE